MTSVPAQTKIPSDQRDQGICSYGLTTATIKERELIPDWISGAETAKIEVGKIPEIHRIGKGK